ncbi:TPA: StfH/YfcO family fimbrial adhesin [Escherichia coli]
MKKLRLLFYFLLALFPLSYGKAATFSPTIYYAEHSWNTQLELYLDVATANGVYYGVYYQDGNVATVGNMPNRTWTGTGNVSAPSISLNHAGTTSASRCPGMAGGWECIAETLTINVDGSVGGCPWIVAVKAHSWSTEIISGKTTHYYGPQTVISSCPPVPLDPYDISWNESTVVHDKLLSLKSTGNVIETTLSTYLMEGGKLCDGSNMDERGAYCRFVSQMITFTSSGCDDAKVTVAPTRHPITDKQLHDMLVRVDTTSEQPIDSTCRFQYVLNML